MASFAVTQVSVWSVGASSLPPTYLDTDQLADVQLSTSQNQKLDLVKIHSLHTQVVAGTNYKFVLDVANEKNEKITYEATVYGTHPYLQAAPL